MGFYVPTVVEKKEHIATYLRPIVYPTAVGKYGFFVYVFPGKRRALVACKHYFVVGVDRGFFYR